MSKKLLKNTESIKRIALLILDIIISSIGILVLIFYLNNCHNSSYEILLIDVLISIFLAKIAWHIHSFIKNMRQEWNNL